MGQKHKRTKIRMEQNTQERRHRKCDDEKFPSTDISHSNSASLPTVISASISAIAMTSSRYFKLGARPKWTAQLTPTQPCPNCGDTSWRDKYLWRITSTKTAEGPETPSSGSKKKTEELCEMKKKKKKKHAMEYAKLLQEYEEGKQRD